jgi:hypothetical protein
MKSVSVIIILFSLSCLASKNELCRENEYIDGIWTRYEDTHNLKKSFFCCDSRTPQLNDLSVCLDEKVGVKKLFYTGNLNYSSSTSAHACLCDYKEGILSVHNREQYYWNPANCLLKNWDAELFCDLLGERTVLLIGDSTMEQTASTLMSMVAVWHQACSPQIKFARADSLYVNLFGVQEPFDVLIMQHQPDIVVLTVGAWCHSIDDFQNVLDEILIRTKTIHSDSRLKTIPTYIWKTQNPGHRSCQHFVNPITKGEEEMLELSTKPTLYEWQLHRKFDEIALNFSLINNFKVINMSPLYYRPDRSTIYI